MEFIRVVEKPTKYGNLLEIRFGLHSNEALNILDYYTTHFCSKDICFNFGLWNIYDMSKWISRADDGEIVCWCTSGYARSLHRGHSLAEVFTNSLLEGIVSARNSGMHGIEKLNLYLMTGRADENFKGTPLDPFVCASIKALKDYMEDSLETEDVDVSRILESKRKCNELMGFKRRV